MKTLRIIITSILLLSLLGCDKSGSEDLNNVDVDRYVELLKEGKYDALKLPEFTNNDIPALLAYRNDTQMIKDFPVNIISSYYHEECKLGIYILWTIESIRAIAIDSYYLIDGFPSQNPILQVTEENSDIPRMVFDAESHEIAAKAYFDWWEENKEKDFDEFKDINPLLETEYLWH
ncbi:DUF4943 family protein [Marinifilum flexuosum]|uniref:Uncharacterized protein DUF4943 n=1 Tax=Marinifilum flexuosum TaxID=1117708 RepID=A0A419X497_9BACT|nr:DUF4943 family protein [Marinifilum flexuosum]RKE02541.1 uncharacterized protein DUF4943 [Marinifilum flexuosum]